MCHKKPKKQNLREGGKQVEGWALRYCLGLSETHEKTVLQYMIEFLQPQLSSQSSNRSLRKSAFFLLYRFFTTQINYF